MSGPPQVEAVAAGFLVVDAAGVLTPDGEAL